MERIHYLIGTLIFLVFVFAASGTPKNPDRWRTSPHVAPLGDKVDVGHKFIALTILAEARGEGKAGMYAVACVIQQRAVNRKKPAFIICGEPDQFSCWNERPYGWKYQHDNLLWEKEAPYALALAIDIENRKIKCEWLKNADHYCHVNINNYWTRGRKPVAIIGRHKFYKLR